MNDDAGFEYLTRMSPGSIDTTAVRVDSSAVPELTPAEIAGLLHDASPIEWALAEHILLGINRRTTVCSILYKESANWKKPERNGDEQGRAIVCAIAFLAFDEFVGCTYCPVCRGEKVVNAKSCTFCSGHGHVHLTDDERADKCYLRPARWPAWQPLLMKYHDRLDHYWLNNRDRLLG